jgi:hypothetical protein
MAKQPKVQIVTPVGTAAYAYFHKPDTGNRFSDNKYKGRLVLPGNTDLSKIEKTIRDFAATVFPNADLSDLQLPWKAGEDAFKDKDEFKGKIVLTAKSKFAPQIVDAKKKTLPKGVKAQSGDNVKFVCGLYAYEQTEKVKEKGKLIDMTIYGVSLQLSVVQVIAKNAGGGGLDLLSEEDGWEPDPDSIPDDTGHNDDGDNDGDF